MPALPACTQAVGHQAVVSAFVFGRILGHDHHGRPEQAAIQGPGGGPGLRNGARRVGARRVFSHRLVKVGIEGLAGRVFAPDAVAFEHTEKAALDPIQAVAQPGDDLGLTRLRPGQAVKATSDVLRGFHNVSGEFLHRILAGFVHLASGSGADIGGFRLGAHPAVLHLGEFGFKLGDAGGGGLHQFLGRGGIVGLLFGFVFHGRFS